MASKEGSGSANADLNLERLIASIEQNNDQLEARLAHQTLLYDLNLGRRLVASTEQNNNQLEAWDAHDLAAREAELLSELENLKARCADRMPQMEDANRALRQMCASFVHATPLASMTATGLRLVTDVLRLQEAVSHGVAVSSALYNIIFTA